MKTPHAFTIGVAGHIDHGKTALTKALTNVDTDRLKEEKERQISIEPGYAPLPLDELVVSIVDVPGHERFIRQMIAGVAGIDLVILVVAADEGVMPQTKEHLDILGYLGLCHGIIAVSKIDRVEHEWLELAAEDIREAVKGTVFADAEMVFVDSLSGKGLDELKQKIKRALNVLTPREANGQFRMPIDQVFHAAGHGTVVRGTVYEGLLRESDDLMLLPQGISVKARQVQVHNVKQPFAVAGQRAAVNLAGIKKEELRRGDVLVGQGGFPLTQKVDVLLKIGNELRAAVKQRAPIKFYTGTSEGMGRLVLFDRNSLQQGDEVLCQIQLDQPAVVKRYDRFVIRRPSPAETIGGGWVLDPLGERYKFGEQTIAMLQRKKAGLPEEAVMTELDKYKWLTMEDMLRTFSWKPDELTLILDRLIGRGLILKVGQYAYTSRSIMEKTRNGLEEMLRAFHQKYPMRMGVNKAECVQAMQELAPRQLVEALLGSENSYGFDIREHQFIALSGFTPYVPDPWRKAVERVMEQLRQDSLGVRCWSDYLRKEHIPESMDRELTRFALAEKWLHPLDDMRYLHRDTFTASIKRLYDFTAGQAFSVQEAKAALQASRKNLVLLLELLDKLRITARTGDQRRWLQHL